MSASTTKDVPSPARGEPRRAGRPHGLYLFMGVLTYPFAIWIFRTKVTGAEHLPREGGFVLVSNHLSNLDPWALATPFRLRRQLRFMAKSELFHVLGGRLRPLLYAAGAYPVRRNEADADAFRASVEIARSGEGIVIFPTGMKESTARRRGVPIKWHTGAARVALAAHVPILPVAIEGMDGLRRLSRIRIAIAPPDDLSDLRHLRTREAATVATERVAATIERMRTGL